MKLESEHTEQSSVSASSTSNSIISWPRSCPNTVYDIASTHIWQAHNKLTHKILFCLF